ncbi:hypothetical protein Ddc_01838 [Ditylenchus destructor]|nr:hypothetical protein Ddc_01838 [Ditylenchus destructor]
MNGTSLSNDEKPSLKISRLEGDLNNTTVKYTTATPNGLKDVGVNSTKYSTTTNVSTPTPPPGNSTSQSNNSGNQRKESSSSSEELPVRQFQEGRDRSMEIHLNNKDGGDQDQQEVPPEALEAAEHGIMSQAAEASE